MEEEIHIGHMTLGGEPVKLNLAKLVETRLLIQASSGAGKSYLLRRIIEQCGIQAIVLDHDGDYATLRKKLDMVLIGPDGDMPADVRTAALLARRLMEHSVSAVIDLSEMGIDGEREYVRAFLQAFMELPRELWHPVVLALDEAHLYAPEGRTCESTDAVIGLNSLGRKRLICGIVATQSLAKLHKDAAADLLNVMVGRTVLDVHQERAAKTLGMKMSHARLVLRSLEDGEFFGFGPAFNTHDVIRFQAAKPDTFPPKRGQVLEPPAPSDAIRGVLAKLADLPKEAEKEAKTVEELQSRIAELQNKLTQQNLQVHEAVADAGNHELELETEIARLRREIEDLHEQLLSNTLRVAEATRSTLLTHIQRSLISGIQAAMEATGERRLLELEGLRARGITLPEGAIGAKINGHFYPAERAIVDTAQKWGERFEALAQVERSAPSGPSEPSQRSAPSAPSEPKGDAAQAILTVLKRFGPRGMIQLAWLAHFHHKTKSFLKALGELRASGMIDGRGDATSITVAGLKFLAELHEADYVGPRFDDVETNILTVLQQSSEGLDTPRLALLAGYHEKTKSFLKALGHLRELDLVVGRGADLRGNFEVLNNFQFQMAFRVPTGPKRWLDKLDAVERAVVESARQNHSTEAIAGGAGMHPKTKTFLKALGRMRALGFLEGRGDSIRATI